MAKLDLRTDDEIVGMNICKIREAHNHSQAFLAKETDYSRNYLCAVENGRTPAGYPLLLRLAKYYHVSLNYFYHGTHTQFAKDRRAKILLTMASEVSDQAIDCTENTLMTFWGVEHKADPQKRYDEIGAEIDKEEEYSNKEGMTE
ncbi:MAG: helix-turn-helix domain-containing protein [Dorea sp.]|nr:helix-turn-helix domain-containing protein [Dorea sp.]